ncbi:hypothetical protein BJV77DRAFT_1047859, partial [Russula vinacea]
MSTSSLPTGAPFTVSTVHGRDSQRPTNNVTDLSRTYAHSHPRCIDTALIFHRPCRRPSKPGLARLTNEWLCGTTQNRGPCEHGSKKDAWGVGLYKLLKEKIKI